MFSLSQPTTNSKVTKTNTVTSTSWPSCNVENRNAYLQNLREWTNCQYCGRQGYGMNSDGTCNIQAGQIPGALQSCSSGPVDPCFPMARPLDPHNPWFRESPHSWGSSVYDPTYGTFILWGTWDSEKGRPYFSNEAPYMRVGKNLQCPF